MMPDFHQLRREGIGHLETTGSAAWTDYNTHDPGITLLEALAYAITELGYRAGFDIADLLASADRAQQAFPSARTILTVNPTTPDDFRRLLVDLDLVRNAWVRCRNCDEPGGLYDVLLELEADPTFGDLNDRTIIRRRTVLDDEGRRRPVTIEVRFPAWGLAHRDERRRLADPTAPITVGVEGPTRTTTGTTPVEDAELRRHWADVFYVDFAITLDDGTPVRIENAAVRVFGDGTVRRRATVAELVGWLADPGDNGFLASYRGKLVATDRAVATARAALDAHRNLDEDHHRVDLVEIDPIGVCADVEVEPAADIEAVQARIWFEIERYLDPPIAFWSRDELLGRGVPIEEVFNGPELANGFLTEEGLAGSDLRSELRVSDILDRLVDVEGVVSVANLRLTAYGADGAPLRGRADPTWIGETPVYDPERTSAAWLLALQPDHRPRLHRRLSRFLFTSNGLPYAPRLDEAEDTLVELHGRAARPKLPATELDLPLPEGRRRRLDTYHPVRHSLPATYGIGPAGLPATATPLRRAQAKQLTAYLMVFDQLLRNSYAQLARSADLFSLDPTIGQTYFSALLDRAGSPDHDTVVDTARLDATALAGLVESPEGFTERRHRFLDHLLARFGEVFGDDARQLAELRGRTGSETDRLHDKLAFLRALPRLGHDRGTAFNRALAPCHPDNTSGLHRRVTLLLGLPDRSFVYRAAKDPAGPGIEHTLALVESGGSGGPGEPVMSFVPPPALTAAVDALATERGLDTSPAAWWIEDVEGGLTLTVRDDTGTSIEVLAAPDLTRELVGAQRDILSGLVLAERYRVVPHDDAWQVEVVDEAGTRIGLTVELFGSEQAARESVSDATTWAAHKRAIVVEHLLLRPKFPGDALFPACSGGEGGCDCADGSECGDDCGQDPYAFRLTYVMPGWTAPFSTGMDMRRFAERTIQEQVPSHLLVKTCWVGNDGYVPDPCAPVVDRLAAVLEQESVTPEVACACAGEVYEAYGVAFEAWLGDHVLVLAPGDVLAQALTAVFEDVDLSGVSCAGAIDAAVRDRLEAPLVEHFTAIAQHGFQFERFEDAWCRWADADAAIDWTGERLADTVVELLAAGATGPVSREELCSCAATVLADFGTGFRTWLQGHLDPGTALDADTLLDADTVPNPNGFDPPAVTLCDGLPFGPDTAEAVRTLLADRYRGYVEVSYRLHVLVRALDALRTTYPRATLHDCDEGSDVNPVRLGQTVLGTT